MIESNGPKICQHLSFRGFDCNLELYCIDFGIVSSVPSSWNCCCNHLSKYNINSSNGSNSRTSLGHSGRIHLWVSLSLCKPCSLNRSVNVLGPNDGRSHKRALPIQPLERSNPDSFCSNCNLVLTSFLQVSSDAYHNMGILARHGTYCRASHTKTNNQRIEHQKSSQPTNRTVVSGMDCPGRRRSRNGQQHRCVDQWLGCSKHVYVLGSI